MHYTSRAVTATSILSAAGTAFSPMRSTGVAAVVAALLLGCIAPPRANTVKYPCGGIRERREDPPEAAPVPGMLIGIVRSPWVGPASVSLDSSALMAQSDAHGLFRFDNVPSGKHVLYTRSLGFLPQVDTVDVPSAGMVTVVSPRLLAACRF